jgi:DNA-binding GntR family transcriptional regulator
MAKLKYGRQSPNDNRLLRRNVMKIKGIAENTVDFLRNRIITGELKPGARLNEAELAAALGVSRAPVREAIGVLEKDNLVARLPRRGTYVPELTIDSLEKVYQARIMIERSAVDLLEKKGIRNLMDAERALGLASKLAMPSAEDKEAMLHYVLTFADFHLGLIKATGNEWLMQFYQSITFNLARFQFICMYVPGLTSKSMEMHKKILGALKKGNYAQTKSLLTTHIEYTVAFIKKHIEGKDWAGLRSASL